MNHKKWGGHVQSDADSRRRHGNAAFRNETDDRRAETRGRPNAARNSGPGHPYAPARAFRRIFHYCHHSVFRCRDRGHHRLRQCGSHGLAPGRMGHLRIQRGHHHHRLDCGHARIKNQNQAPCHADDCDRYGPVDHGERQPSQRLRRSHCRIRTVFRGHFVSSKQYAEPAYCLSPGALRVRRNGGIHRHAAHRLCADLHHAILQRVHDPDSHSRLGRNHFAQCGGCRGSRRQCRFHKHCRHFRHRRNTQRQAPCRDPRHIQSDYRNRCLPHSSDHDRLHRSRPLLARPRSRRSRGAGPVPYHFQHSGYSPSLAHDPASGKKNQKMVPDPGRRTGTTTLPRRDSPAYAFACHTGP